ncbi:MAG TPA: hypothetical protein DEA08_34250, partial [Planctomycetes bacterium]|nr:hypothetical protein [Planctomycetota bacterium]
GRAEALEELGQLARARDVYGELLTRQGEGVPGSAQIQLAMKGLSAQIDAKLKVDLPRVEGLLAEGKGEAALALLEDVESYAGAASQAERLRYREQAVAMRAPKPQPSASPKVTPEGGTPKDPDPKVQALASARAALAKAQKLLEEGKLGEAEAALAEARKLGKDLPELKEDLASASSALAAAKQPKEMDRGKALAALFKGKLETEGEGDAMTLSLAYDFADEAQGEDWRGPRHMGDRGEIAKNWLNKLPLPKGAPVEPWGVYTKKKSLLGYGHDRRRLLASFSREAPITVELTAYGRENVLVAFGTKQPIVAGVGYLLPELPTATLRGNGEIRGALARAIQRSRGRGPSVAVLRERFPGSYEELLVKQARGSKKVRLSVTLEPGEDDLAEARVTIKVNRKTLVTYELEEAGEGPVDVSLLTLGSAVRYDKVQLSGRPSKRFRNLLERACKEVSKEGKHEDFDAFRARFHKLDEGEKK